MRAKNLTPPIRRLAIGNRGPEDAPNREEETALEAQELFEPYFRRLFEPSESFSRRYDSTRSHRSMGSTLKPGSNAGVHHSKASEAPPCAGIGEAFMHGKEEHTASSEAAPASEEQGQRR